MEGRDAHAGSTSLLCLQKEVTGGAGGCGGDAGEDAGPRQRHVRAAADPGSQSRRAELIPGTAPARLNCAHLADEIGTAGTAGRERGARGNPPGSTGRAPPTPAESQNPLENPLA